MSLTPQKLFWPSGSSKGRRREGSRLRRARLDGLEQRWVFSSIPVLPGLDTLLEAVDEADPGDTLVLKPGVFQLSETVEIDKDLRIVGSSSHADKVHIIPVADDYLGPGTGFEGEHLLSVVDTLIDDEIHKVFFVNFTVQGAPEDDPNAEDVVVDFDGIHLEYVEHVTITNVASNLNGGDGIYIIGALDAQLRKVVAINNGAFGIDVDSALKLTVADSRLVGNGISGLEAAGHDRADITFTATVTITNTVATHNGEIGIEVERFKKATLEKVTCSNNVEDGFDADRVYVVKIRDSVFANNLGDGLELFPINVPDYPDDFAFNIVEDFKGLKIYGNRGLPINHPPTEN